VPGQLCWHFRRIGLGICCCVLPLTGPEKLQRDDVFLYPVLGHLSDNSQGKAVPSLKVCSLFVSGIHYRTTQGVWRRRRAASSGNGLLVFFILSGVTP